MNERFKSKRVYFSNGDQKKFLLKGRSVLNVDWKELANISRISIRQMNDWRNEKYSIPLDVVENICSRANIKFPKEVEIKNSYWHVKKAGRKGGLAVLRKYGFIGGDEEKRKKKWKEWWNNEGKFKKNNLANIRLSIKRPHKNKKLAEFVGILLGDGGISDRQVTVSLHHQDDKNYVKFVVKLFEDLFKVKPSVYHRPKKSIKYIVVSRTDLVDFCVKDLGLKVGNKVKQKADIPSWIKKNKDFSEACLRGLIDTDGSVFDHKYKSRNKIYCYKKLQFTSLSEPLLFSVYEIFQQIGLKARFSRGKEVWLDSKESMKKYFEIIGFNNDKHLKKYNK